MHGRVFEKVGVNTSTVNGLLSPEAAKTWVPDDDRRFWASSISLIAHMRNPHVPAVRMNTRHMITTTGSWFGGGADLTPMYPNAEDEADFHAAMQRGCRVFGSETYEKYKKWCDEYFYLPHRKEPRGAGGIFYDRHNSGDWEKDFAFTQDVGMEFASVYPQIIRRRMGQSWTDAERHHQLVKRGRYVEFNLMWDRGTLFGLKTGHNIDAILCRCPRSPLAIVSRLRILRWIFCSVMADFRPSSGRLIDIVLAGDNALVIGMAAARVPQVVRRKVIFWGLVAAWWRAWCWRRSRSSCSRSSG